MLFRAFSHGISSALGIVLGYTWYYLIPIRRRVALENLTQSLPGLDQRTRHRIVRGCFVHLASSAVEFLRLPSYKKSFKTRGMIEFVGFEHLERALLEGRGVIVVTAHYGNFDLMACLAALKGLPLHVVTRRQKISGFQRFWMTMRSQFGLGFILPKDTAWKIGRLLGANQVVAMVIDQHMPPGRGIIVPFFGRAASTTHAPALFAWLTKASLIPAVAERLPGGRHRFTIEPPVEPNRKADRESEIKRLTRYFNLWLESKIEANPRQWLWIHRRWKV